MAFDKEDEEEGYVIVTEETGYRNLEKKRNHALIEPDYDAWFAGLSADTRIDPDFVNGYLRDRMRAVGEKASRLTGKPYVEPDFYFNDDLGDAIAGATYIDKKGDAKGIAFNPSITEDYEQTKMVAGHEAIHAVQKGLHVLADVYAELTDERTGQSYLFAIGRAIAEGDNEFTSEAIGEGATGAYSEELGLARGLDSIYPNKRLFRTAENQDYETLEKMLNYEEAKGVIDSYLKSKLGRAGRAYTSSEMVYAPASE
ncbi:MAG: hypothetical protein HYX24_01560 [Candidatus Aenigmarchaeota archaeon]|nr:hypothetical protein [Candidatus Aenigmarchaeota archaeon]